MAYVDVGDTGFPGIWNVFGQRVKKSVGKLINTLMLRQGLEAWDKLDVSEEDLQNLINDAIFASDDHPTSMDLDEIIGEMELMGLLIPTTIDPSDYNQNYTVNVSEAMLRERFEHYVELDANSKTTYAYDEDPKAFKENLRLFIKGVLNETSE